MVTLRSEARGTGMGSGLFAAWIGGRCRCLHRCAGSAEAACGNQPTKPYYKVWIDDCGSANVFAGLTKCQIVPLGSVRAWKSSGPPGRAGLELQGMASPAGTGDGEAC
jgi:hypothetical protein